ncbi:MAG: hypothetical protein ACLGHN_00535 [Bacteriovoracia bacterium]
MNIERPFGFYLFTKSSRDHKVLKDLLQFVKTVSPGKGNSFSYIEAETSLHPHLSLWENLQLEAGISSVKDLTHLLKPEQSALVNLLKRPDMKSKDAEIWEKFLVSLLKGLISPSHNLLIDMNEELLSPFLIQSFKRAVLHSTDSKVVYLASANSSLWLDCAHTIVGRKEYQFEIQSLNAEMIKKHWAA